MNVEEESWYKEGDCFEMSSRCRLRGRTRLFDAHAIPLQVFMIEGYLIEQEYAEKERLARLPLLNWRKKIE